MEEGSEHHFTTFRGETCLGFSTFVRNYTQLSFAKNEKCKTRGFPRGIPRFSDKLAEMVLYLDLYLDWCLWPTLVR